MKKVSNTIDSTREWTLRHFNSLPEWMQDNEYLHHGHRPPTGSFAACFASIFKVHTGKFTFLLYDIREIFRTIRMI